MYNMNTCDNSSHSGSNDIQIKLDKRNTVSSEDNGNISPIASLVTQVARPTGNPVNPRVNSPTINGYTPTPVAGTPSQINIQNRKNNTRVSSPRTEEDGLDLSAIQFSVPTPLTPLSGASTPNSQMKGIASPNAQSPKRSKIMNYLMKSFSWCFSNEQQQQKALGQSSPTTNLVKQNADEDDESESANKQEDNLNVDAQADDNNWNNKRLTNKKTKKSVASPSSPTQAQSTGPSVRKLNIPPQKFLLNDQQSPRSKGKKCLVLDLDETLVHSCFSAIPNPDFVIPIEIEGNKHMVYVLKRPFVDDFMLEMSRFYEIVVFTASLSKYANPLLDQLDKHNVISARLFREHCTYIDNCYIKDLARLGRDISQSLIIDNSPTCYALQPQNAMAVSSWYDDPKDTQLQQMIPWLVKMSGQDDVYETLQEYRVFYSQSGWNGGNQRW
ncbi:hypothetical protein AKO1_006059 [Acrasis kona]|uniref:FCP1 homology domain-containing protein n=1 Tax=Acrasis kona TaxID=1008807 RepID=A0AAW2YHD8_9EUKA